MENMSNKQIQSEINDLRKVMNALYPFVSYGGLERLGYQSMNQRLENLQAELDKRVRFG